VRRDLATTLTLQTRTVTGSGTERAATWTDGSDYRLEVAPAGKAALERAQLMAERVTHTALAPRGLALSTDGHRFKSGSTIYRIVEVVDTPRKTVVSLEVLS